MPKQTSKALNGSKTKATTLRTHLNYNPLMDMYRMRRREHLFRKDLGGERGYSGASDNLNMGILEHLLNRNHLEFLRLTKRAVCLALENAQAATTAIPVDFHWVLRAAAIDEHDLARDLARALKRLDTRDLRGRKYAHELMRELTLDLFANGKIDNATRGTYSDDCKPVGVRDGYVELLLGIATLDGGRIETAANFIHRNITKHASDTGLFSHESEAWFDFWALGLIRHARKRGISAPGLDLIEHYYHEVVHHFDPEEVNTYDAIASDRECLIAQIKFAFCSSLGYDNALRSKENGQTLAENVMKTYELARRNGKSLHDVYDNQDITRIFDVILPSHEFNHAGWCRICLTSIETSIKNDQPCTGKPSS